MVTITTLALFAATWLLFGGIAAVLWWRTGRATEREDALRISMETMLMRSRFRDAPPVSPTVLGRVAPDRLDVRVEADDGAGDAERDCGDDGDAPTRR